MTSRVQVLRVTRVHAATAATGAGADEHEHELSFFDAIHVTRVPTQRLFFFDGPDLPPFPSIVSALRSSLADTLAVFFPLTGELAFRPSSGTVVLDYSSAVASIGVRFVEAEYLGGTEDDDMRRMAREDVHDTEAFQQLVPELEVAQLPAPVLAVQVTRGHGAVAVGVSMHHAVADGQAMWQFMRAWSAATREGSGSLVVGASAGSGLVPPTFDRAAILQHPMAAELYSMVLRLWAPALPMLRQVSSTSAAEEEMSRRTFVLTADRIQSLKCHISQQGGGELPTTYVAVSSLMWASIVRAKSLDHHADEVYLMIVVDCRRRLRPPLGEGYFGNCVWGWSARANVGELCGEGGVARAAVAIRDCIGKVLDKEDPVDGMDLVPEAMMPEAIRDIHKDTLTTMVSSHRFMAYETDFGWGVPSRVELLISDTMLELVVLHGAREGGAVQVTLALAKPFMESFATNFLNTVIN